MKIERTTWTVSDKLLPVKIHLESRRDTRISVGKNEILVRFPLGMQKTALRSQIKWAQNWLKKLINKSPEAVSHLTIEKLPPQYTLNLWEEKYTVKINYHDLKSAHASLNNCIVEIELPKRLDNYNLKQTHIRILSKIIAKQFINKFSIRLDDLNRATYNVKYNNVKLKYMTSQWGSCSNKGNLNFSTRLLLCPEFVIDYIIVHELAHRIVQNHSRKFWSVVEKGMPNYRHAEQWIKINGDNVDFLPV